MLTPRHAAKRPSCTRYSGPATPYRADVADRKKPYTYKRSLRADAAAVLSPDVVKSVFTTYNTVLLLPWALMIFVPNLDFTKSIIKSNIFLIVFSIVYAYLFVAATAQACSLLLSHPVL